MPVETGAATESVAWSEPTTEELAEALSQHVATNGAVRRGVAAELATERHWRGRRIDVLAVLTEDATRMGYLAGGRKPDEIITWLAPWVDAPLTLDEIRMIVASAGWDPEPFGVVVREGLLDQLVHRADGSPRRVRGELAGAWLSDQFALADDEQEIVAAVRQVIEEGATP